MSERQRPQSKVSLEDLLRLKRAERPEPEFWAKFEDQLRRKQLAAIVDKRPWWRRLSSASIARVSIPVGATAIITFTLVTVSQRKQITPEVAAVSTVAVGSSSSASVPTEVTMRSSTAEVEGALIPAVEQTATPVSTQTADVGNLTNMPGSNRSSSENNGNVGAVQDAREPSLAQVILGLEETIESGDVRSQYQAGTVSLLASTDIWNGSLSEDRSSLESSASTKVPFPRDDRRARLLASVDSQDQGDLVSGNPRVAKSRERIANRLAEQSLYDSISRLGLNGDSVSIKF